MIILPRLDDNPKSKEDAQKKLNDAIADPVTVVMIVYGDNAETRKALEICDARASVKANIRKVVWCPDERVLSDEQRKIYFMKGKTAVSIGLADKIADSLIAAKASVKLYVEGAFIKAEGQKI